MSSVYVYQLLNCIYWYLVSRLGGTGIRLEDDVVVTEGGAEVLNKGCPEIVEEVTQLISSSQ